MHILICAYIISWPIVGILYELWDVSEFSDIKGRELWLIVLVGTVAGWGSLFLALVDAMPLREAYAWYNRKFGNRVIIKQRKGKIKMMYLFAVVWCLTGILVSLWMISRNQDIELDDFIAIVIVSGITGFVGALVALLIFGRPIIIIKQRKQKDSK